MPFKIVRNDITKMHTEAIVNTANSYLTVGSGCDLAVYRAAGYEKLLQYRKERIGCVPEGEAFITPGFDLQAKYIIHAVSPLYQGGDAGEEELLRSCYRKSLALAKENHIRSIAFPLIATGSFGYPKEEGMRIAVDEMHAFLLKNEMQIYLVVFDGKATALGENLYPDLERYIDRNYVRGQWEKEYGERDDDRSAVSAAFQRANRPYPSAAGRAGKESGTSGIFSIRRRSVKKRSPEAGKSFSAENLSEKAEMADDSVFSASEAAPWREEAEFQEDTYEDFLEVHERKLEERMQHVSDTFSQYLLYLIRDKNMQNADVYKRAIVDKKIFSKIKNNVYYHPQKLTALCLCVGAKLNLDEAKDLLARAGYALSPCDKTDIIFSYFIENKIYDMIELDIQLEEHGLPCIIS